MSRVILINPNQMKPAVAPIALDYLGHALAEAGFDVSILDLCWSDDPLEDIRRGLERERFVAVGFTIRNTDDCYYSSQDFFLPVYRMMIDAVKSSTSAPIVLGGAGFSVMPEAVLDYCGVDLGVWGEGEVAFPQLVAKLSRGEPIAGVPGLVYRTDDGFRRNTPTYLALDRAKAPRRATVANYFYFSEGGQGNVETKRGCNKGCIYCADPVSKGRSIRLRSPSSVADEMEDLLSQGVDCFHLCDAEFNLPDFHAKAVCEELIRRNLGESIRWYTYASPTPFDDDLAVLMKRAGCTGINFGADSGCDEILKRLGRDFTSEDLVRTADICKRHDIVFMYDLLLAGPGETRETARRSVELMQKIAPDRVGTAVGVRVYPETALARWVLNQGPLDANPNLKGSFLSGKGDGSFLAPVFFVNASLGEDPVSYIHELVDGDPRFFVGSSEDVDQNYNYNDNSILVNAIMDGKRGAYWDILRRISGE